MVSEYTKHGIQFQYPENWELEENDTDLECQTVSLYNPNGAFWSVSIHPRSTEPQQLLDAVTEAMRSEYQQVEIEEITETIADRELLGRDINFFCLDLTNTACVRCLQGDRATYTIFYQAEDREFNESVPLFLAITTSFLSSVRNLNYWDNRE
ncbi:MAG: hypothetical protein PVH19_07340 [Planctomycetia bacterium]|jgi:hypothetical protein